MTRIFEDGPTRFRAAILAGNGSRAHGMLRFPGGNMGWGWSTQRGNRCGKCLFPAAGSESRGTSGKRRGRSHSLRPELAAVARTLQARLHQRASSLLYLCDSKTTLDKVSRWIERGPRATLTGDANADIMKIIIECARERVMRGARTFMVQIKGAPGKNSQRTG
jgi:ribonuclease HI